MTTQEQRRTRRTKNKQASNEARHRIVEHLRERGYAVEGTEPMEHLVATLNELWEEENQQQEVEA